MAYLTSVSAGSSKNSADTAKSAVSALNNRPLLNVIHLIPPQQNPKTGKQDYNPAIATVELKDTGKVNQYLSLDVVKNNFPADLKFLYGIEEKDQTNNKRYLLL